MSTEASSTSIACGQRRARAAWLGTMPWSLAIAAVACVTGCLELQSTTRNDDRTCTACHGNERRDGDSLTRAAPPRDTQGRTSTSERSVGAHELHLSNRGHATVACDQCHQVPETVLSAGHIDTDDPAEVTFGTLAHAGQHQPTYNADATCSDTYCHREAQPQWNVIREERDSCGTCHGLPPALPHPQKANCAECHSSVVDVNRNWVDATLHVNGKVDVKVPGKCSACHGTNDDTGAPPPDLLGNTEPTATGVGAHAQHLNASESHAAVACQECHRIPQKVEDEGHIDSDGHAEVTFGTLAQTGGAKPEYTRERGSCANSYCHGQDSGDWHAPRDSSQACGSCHALPPPAPHPQQAECSHCHGRVMGPNQRIINPSLHVNGTVEVDYTNGCASCHGTGTNGAPPPDLSGNTDPSARGVGAHTQHLVASATHRALACNECHRVPATLEEPQHMDGDNVAEVTFGALASSNGYRPSYDATAVSCAATYCHRDSSPNWRAPRKSPQACGSCHALPPAWPHPRGTDCSQCHQAVIDAQGRFRRPELHVDGVVEVGVMACNSCHGTDASGLPPPDNQGNTDPTTRGVGAHALHAQASPSHSPIACNECHVVPTSVDALGHRDSPLPAEVTFGTLAQANGAKPEYSPSLLTCKNSYCHGIAVPNWIAPHNVTDTCGTCHELPPKAPHPAAKQCYRCHGQVVDASGQFLRPDRHVNGQVEVEETCVSCHGSSNSAAPPTDVAEHSDPAQIGVGAHQAHLTGGISGRPLACTECHTVPATIDAPGHLDVGAGDPADVTLVGVATTKGRVPTWDHATATCTNSWCHGPTDAQNRSLTWTDSGKTTCTSCHGMPPPEPHTSIRQCSFCHAGVDVNGTITDRQLHVNGKVDLL